MHPATEYGTHGEVLQTILDQWCQALCFLVSMPGLLHGVYARAASGKSLRRGLMEGKMFMLLPL